MARRRADSESPLPDGSVIAGRSSLPEQSVHGSVDLWPLLRDPASAQAIMAGEYDAILVELDEMARAHVPSLAPATAARLAVLGT